MSGMYVGKYKVFSTCGYCLNICRKIGNFQLRGICGSLFSGLESPAQYIWAIITGGKCA